MKSYRLLTGKHYEGIEESRKTYNAGEIVRSDTNLLVFNQPGCIKFELVDEEGQPSKSSKHNDGLDPMTVSQLRAMAAEEEIDLGSASRKDEIIKIIRSTLVSTAAEEGFNS